MSNIFFILTLSVALATSGALANNKAEGDQQYSSPASGHGVYSPTHDEGMGGGYGHYYPKPPKMTCDKFPNICYAYESPGPFCCNKRCVDVGTDNQNCGWCGQKCGYGKMCCQGQCVNIMNDPRHCGGCSKKCKNGSGCRYGMCNYA